MKLFFGEINQDSAILSEEESHHFAKVLRGNEGDKIHVTDGKGNMAECEVVSVSKKAVEAKIIDLKTDFEKKNYYLHVAIAPTKTMERLEFFLEKATEIGIDEITFLQSFHSERKNIKLERIEKIVQSATKQSLKAYLPKVNDLTKFTDFVKTDFTNFTKCIAHCEADITRTPFENVLQTKPQHILIMIGPEGDFSRDEILLAQENNFTGISLGQQRFRTETAALQAVFATDWELK
ncbi:16S rRNA (uracil1498-N3)-methyltransferase [Algoriella xinjiangensis]|uniref:Ribosomal RNA small subunit methyltransferase E n=1 Tax=Algoriella xinjiangensis TaxID=684065 RepID=A0A1I4Y5B5_9FLAO|nr:RsmE family RNA methyltransferase [Algoriella xinjiangensis]SFN33251.1 16S rRNA (uracil1498-N3)-methyltransferase [Algoriella xinjiangensis]VDH15275.1 Ribosomal RNA small subunit methyltransferase E [Algoriella xinjiangensis]